VGPPKVRSTTKEGSATQVLLVVPAVLLQTDEEHPRALSTVALELKESARVQRGTSSTAT